MTTKTFLMQAVDKLSPEQQKVVLDLVRRMQGREAIVGTSGNALIEQMDRFQFAAGAVDEMMGIIDLKMSSQRLTVASFARRRDPCANRTRPLVRSARRRMVG